MKRLAHMSGLVLAAMLGIAGASAAAETTLVNLPWGVLVSVPAAPRGATASAVAATRSSRATTAPAVHTSARARHRHHRIHRAAPPSLRATRVTTSHATSPMPSGRPHRTTHRHATVPHVSHSLRPHRGAKTNAQAMAATTGGVLLGLDVRALDPRQNLEPNESVDVVKSGRGPPRAGPFTTPSARRPDEPVDDAHPSASVPSASSSSHIDRSPSAVPRAHAPSKDPRTALSCPDRALAPVRFPPEAVPSSLHAGRTEGKAACFREPSIGGI